MAAEGGGTSSAPSASLDWLAPVANQARLVAETNARTQLRTYGNRMTADGSVVVGESMLFIYQSDTDFVQHSEPFRWTKATGSVGLGTLPGVDPNAATALPTEVDDMSADGSVLVGLTASANGSRVVFLWTQASGMVALPVPSGADIATIGALSADGAVVVGSLHTPDGERAFRWAAQSGMVVLGALPGDTTSQASWLSADGSVVTGESSSATAAQPFRWTAGTGLVGLGSLPMTSQCGLQPLQRDAAGSTLFGTCTPGAFLWTAASGIQSLGAFPGYSQLEPWNMSSDGQAISGDATTSDGQQQVFYWTPDSGAAGLGFLPGFDQSTGRPGLGMSRDGSVVVGSSSDAAGYSLAFRWTKAAGMQSLAPLPGHNQTEITSVTTDGSIAAGYSEAREPLQNPSAGPEAVLWDASLTPISVTARLEASGIDLGGAQLTSAFVFSSGSLLLGSGVDASGGLRGFVARVPL